MTATILHLPVRTQRPSCLATDPEITWLFLPMTFYLAWVDAGMKLWAARL